MAQTLKSSLERDISMRSFQDTHPKSVHSVLVTTLPFLLFSYTHQYLFSFLISFLPEVNFYYCYSKNLVWHLVDYNRKAMSFSLFLFFFLDFSFPQTLKRERMLLTGSLQTPQKHVLGFSFLWRIGYVSYLTFLLLITPYLYNHSNKYN